MRLRKYFGEQVDSSLLAIQAYLIDSMKPKVFNPYDEECVLVENDRRNEDLMNVMEESGLHVKDVTVYEFYNKIRFLENRAKQLKERHK